MRQCVHHYDRKKKKRSLYNPTIPLTNAKNLLESCHLVSRYATYPENQYLLQENIYSINVFNGLWLLVKQ